MIEEERENDAVQGKSKAKKKNEEVKKNNKIWL